MILFFHKKFISGQGWIKHFIHMFTLLSGSRTNIWCNRIHSFYWYLVSWLCSCWTSSRTGYKFLEIYALMLLILKIFLLSFWDMLYWLHVVSNVCIAIISWRKPSGPTCGNYQGDVPSIWVSPWIAEYICRDNYLDVFL